MNNPVLFITCFIDGYLVYFGEPHYWFIVF